MVANRHLAPLLEEHRLFQMYAISTKAKDIRLVVVDLNAKRADIDTALTKPHAKPQPASSTQHQHSQWTSFVTEVLSNTALMLTLC